MRRPRLKPVRMRWDSCFTSPVRVTSLRKKLVQSSVNCPLTWPGSACSSIPMRRPSATPPPRPGWTRCNSTVTSRRNFALVVGKMVQEGLAAAAIAAAGQRRQQARVIRLQWLEALEVKETAVSRTATAADVARKFEPTSAFAGFAQHPLGSEGFVPPLQYLEVLASCQRRPHEDLLPTPRETFSLTAQRVNATTLHKFLL